MTSMRTHTILAALIAAVIAVAGFSAAALSQASTKRGYGGPLSVGPNFKTGGQWTTSDFGSKKKKKKVYKAKKKKTYKAKKYTKPKKRVVKKTTPATESESEDSTASKEENSSETKQTAAANGSSDIETGATDDRNGSQNCTHFDATTGRAIPVPCN